MTRQQLASLIAHREGKKSQAQIGDIREILRVQIDLAAEELVESPEVPIEEIGIFKLLIEGAKKRATELRRKR